MDINKGNLWGRYFSKFYDNSMETWTQGVIVEQVFFEEKFKSNFVRVEVIIHYCHTKHNFDILVSAWF